MEKSRMLFGVLTGVVVILSLIVHYQYLMVQKEKNVLEENLKILKKEKETLVNGLEKNKIDLSTTAESLSKITQEKEALGSELEQIRIKLLEGEEALSTIKSEFANYQSEKTQFIRELESLKKNYDSLKIQFDAATQEKVNLESNLNSVGYLKKALVKAKMKERLAWLEEKKQKYMQAYARTKYGNRGFIIKDTKPTTQVPQVNVEVLPAE